MFRVNRVIAPLVVLAVGAAACGSSGALPADVAAEVNGESISATTLSSLVDALSQDQQVDDSQRQQAERNILSSLIQSVVATDLAAENGIEVSEQEADELYDEQAQSEAEQFNMDEQAYKEYLLVPTEAVQRLSRQFGEDVPEEEIRSTFDEEASNGQHEVATVSHILVDSEQAANDAIDRINGGEAFEDVATEVSTDTQSAQNGGSLGEDTPIAGFVEPFANAIRDATLGELTGPVETQFGWHVLRVDDRSTLTFEDRAPQIREELARPEVQSALQTAIDEAEVTVASRIGVWDPATGAVQAEEDVGQAPTPGGGQTQPPAPAPTGTPTPAPTEG